MPNGLALSGTVHWIFDRGLLSVADDERILLSNHINDVDGVRKILNANGRARFPDIVGDRPDAAFLGWHRRALLQRRTFELKKVPSLRPVLSPHIDQATRR